MTAYDPFRNQPCEHCVCKWGGGLRPPNPPAVLSRVQACLTASVAFLQFAMQNMSLIERYVGKQGVGPPACASLLDSI